MRGRAKSKKGSGCRISRVLKELRKRSYSSAEEYHEKISAAASAFGEAALKLARIEADHFLNRSLKLPKERTLEVHPTGDATVDFAKIQNAVDNASPGDRILLKPGVFKSGGAVWVDKDLSIEGAAGATIEGTTHHRGKVVADPDSNGGFILYKNPKVEIRNLDFRNLYFAVASRDDHELDKLFFENNICEDVYHSVYAAGRSELTARNNRILITSLNPASSKCRFNFYDESHVFGFYCDGADAFLQGNHLEVLELSASQPFHAVGTFCAAGKAVVSNNFYKGWHAPVVIHDSHSPVVFENEVHGLSEDSQFSPVAISLRDCKHPHVCLNHIKSRNLGSGGAGISVSNADRGSLIGNSVDLVDGENGLVLHKSNKMIVGRNRLSCPLALFGDQTEDVKGNLLFGNSVDHRIELKINYASGNTLIGKSARRAGDEMNVLLGSGSVFEEASPARLGKEDLERRGRMFEHLNRRVWPSKRL